MLADAPPIREGGNHAARTRPRPPSDSGGHKVKISHPDATPQPEAKTPGLCPEPRRGFSTPGPPSDISPTQDDARSPHRSVVADHHQRCRQQKSTTPLPHHPRTRRNEKIDRTASEATAEVPNRRHTADERAIPLWKNCGKLIPQGVHPLWTPARKNDRVPSEWTPSPG